MRGLIEVYTNEICRSIGSVSEYTLNEAVRAGVCRVKVGDGQEINKFIAATEVESIFKATEWVLEQLKNKGK